MIKIKAVDQHGGFKRLAGSLSAAIALATSLTAITANAQTNLLQDGGFEGLTSGDLDIYWASSAGTWGAEFSEVSNDSFGVDPLGSEMLLMYEAGGGSASQAHQFVEGPFPAGTQVTLEAKFNTHLSGISSGLIIEARDNFVTGPTFRSTNVSFSLDSDPSTWETFSVTVTLASATPYLAAELIYWHTGPDFLPLGFVDDVVLTALLPDSDGDGIPDNEDDFPFDFDNDGIDDGVDNCPADSNPDQFDFDYDGVGDACDPDIDGDGVLNENDDFPNDPDETTDTDGDGVGDNGDAFPNDPTETTDSDGDGVGDNADAFPNDPTETTDSDGDGVGDNADAFPNDPTETTDTDGDGVGDNADAFPNDPTETTDSDGDGVGDNADAFPNDPTETADSDGDGVGDNADAFPNDPTETTDTDGDGYGDNSDVFPNDPSEWADSDNDGIGDNADQNDNSDTSATVVIEGVDSGVTNQTYPDGNTLSDLVTAASAGCAVNANNHGKYVSCMAKFLNGLLAAGQITDAEKDALQSAAAQTSIGKKAKAASKGKKK